jgi:hypothetical protein
MADPLNAGSVARRVKSVSSNSVKEVMIFLRYDYDASAPFERGQKARQAM